MTVLFVNACVRYGSRTKILADYLLKKLNVPFDEINLNKDYPKPFNESLLNKRNQLIQKGAFDDSMFDYAKAFSKAETIVVAAPFWDFSFPALLKTFIEHVNVNGLVFKYTDQGIVSLCKAKTLYYITTMGGYNPTDYGFGYIKALSETLYGIKNIQLIKAEGLDVMGNNVNEILDGAKKQIDQLFN